MNYSCGCCTSSQSIRFFCVKGTVAWISSWHLTDAGRLSKKFSRLAVDSELWKALFYRTFVRPRASRIPRIKDAGGSASQLHYSSKISRWLDDVNLVKNGVGTNWKNQYRLRHNWSQGQCAVSEIVVAERSPNPPPLLVMMSKNTVFAADSVAGLRAWSSKHEGEILATTRLAILKDETETLRLPISMALDSSDNYCERIAMGFADGSFSVYALKTDEHRFALKTDERKFALKTDAQRFECLYTHPTSSNGALAAMAYSSVSVYAIAAY
jgi:hypothetical protein